ncbi:putative membrane protein [Candidatus Ichthyocystis hellenicum]|uniref:Putative membrane protein n=1 Tax=Candidatus Ichthyocystis hellenicum TaxID=1561003 RepID=A0A0S4M3M0_9BURK|nr:hypothetical protein [Candidatus Ichthyocystis hellenicum]CUT18377.1 putative membrane protein [Candidatus Ichthyocystis hellenicum]
MKSCDSYFFRETTEDGDRSDSGALLNNHLLLNSVSQSSVSSRSLVPVRRGMINRFLKRIILPANIIMSSAIFMSLVVGINAEDKQIEESWGLLLSRLCLLISLQRTVGHLKNDRRFKNQGDFPAIDVKSELESMVGGDTLIKNSMSHDSVVEVEKFLSSRAVTVISDLKARLSSAGIDRQPVHHAQYLYSSENLDIESCPNLHEYLDNTVSEITSTTLASTVATTIPTTASTSTTVQVTVSTVFKSTLDAIVSAVSTDTPNSVSVDTNNATTVPYSVANVTEVLPDAELSSSFTRSILVIFMAALSLFALIFFCAKYKKHSVTDSALKYIRYIRIGGEARVVLSEELEERDGRILPPLLVVENEYEGSPHSHSVGNACSANSDSDFMKDLEVEDLEENIYESID